MKKRTEYALASIATNKVFSKGFSTKEEAEICRLKRSNPSRWKIVSREVTLSEWE